MLMDVGKRARRLRFMRTSPDNGLYKYNGTTWTQVNTVVSTSMTASSSALYANFAGYGLYKYDGAAWSQINTVVSTSMTARVQPCMRTLQDTVFTSTMAPHGVRLIQSLRQTMLVSGSTLYANFAGYVSTSTMGRHGTRINTVVSTGMATSGSVLYANFADTAFTSTIGATWSQINYGCFDKHDGLKFGPVCELCRIRSLQVTMAPHGARSIRLFLQNMTASSSALYANFAGYGLYKYDGTTWTQVNSVVAASMVISDQTVLANFTGYGLYMYEGTTWAQINTVVSDSMVIGP